ncbi:MAG: transposase [Ignavibacteria bacterium]|nr:transposase [Ignavibacteria bacterium]MCU7502704.1 transposase [Ignavibacteria bacterium]MCU7517367.1 transposase [Ignavibacteria bacterium]
MSVFKTLKYRPDFPECFHSIEEARMFSGDFFNWYNKSHKHSGIAYFTPLRTCTTEGLTRSTFSGSLS